MQNELRDAQNEQFWVLAKFKYPTHQINFCTKEALKCLEYRGYEVVE